jgi:hypothetical protein
MSPRQIEPVGDEASEMACLCLRRASPREEGETRAFLMALRHAPGGQAHPAYAWTLRAMVQRGEWR